MSDENKPNTLGNLCSVCCEITEFNGHEILWFDNDVNVRGHLNLSTKNNKKRRNATKTRFSMIQPSIDMTGIRNERWH